MSQTARLGWIVSLALLSACDGAPNEAEPEANVAPAAADGDAKPANQLGAKDSVIRRSVLEETEPEPPPPPERIELTVPFADAGGSLPDNAPAAIAAFVEQPAVAGAECIVISGHTDSRGSDQQNLKASQRRAELVRDELVERGIGPERLRLIAVGERRPIAANARADGSDFPEGRAKNRRVTVRAVTPGGEAENLCTAGAGANRASAER